MSANEAPDAILTNARIILADDELSGTVTVRNGKIEDISEGRSAASGAIDYDGDYLIAGLVELHTDNLEKHLVRARRPLACHVCPAGARCAGDGSRYHHRA